jgi:hypothetical protein
VTCANWCRFTGPRMESSLRSHAKILSMSLDSHVTTTLQLYKLVKLMMMELKLLLKL